MSNGLRRGKFLKRAGLVIAAGACAMLLSASQASAVLIDHFDCGTFYDVGSVPVDGGALKVFSGDVGPPVIPGQLYDSRLKTGLLPAAVMGGQRFAELYYIVDGTGATASAAVIPGGLLDYNNPAAMRSRLVLTYDGGGSLVADLSAEALFAAHFESVDQDALMTVTVYDGDSNSTSLSHSVPSGDSQILVPFTEFSGITWTGVTKLVFEFTNGPGREAVDFELHSLDTTSNVPEPLTMLGMFLGLGSVGAYIRKRRMA